MLSIGRQGQLYVIKEVTYGVTPALAASNAVRHKSVTFPSDNKNRRTILEKKQSPWTITAARTDQRKTASHNLTALLRPSGTINTLPECDPVLEAAFGSKTNVTLSTTVTGGTTTSGTLASAAGLAVNDAILITCPDGKKRLRFLTTAGVSAVWAPALPAGQAPAGGASVKGVITYKLTTLLAISLSLAHYLKKTDGTAGMKRVVSGAVIDKLSLMFDANDEPTITASGPAKSLDDAPAQPGGFTMVGGQPPSGLIGDLVVGASTIIKFMKLGIDISNAMFLRNEDYGDAAAVEAFRQGRPEIQIGIDQRAETEADLYDLAEAGTNTGVFSQTGYTEGNCVAVRAPLVEFKIPDTDDPDDVVNYPFKGLALESADSANDSLFLAIG